LSVNTMNVRRIELQNTLKVVWSVERPMQLKKQLFYKKEKQLILQQYLR
jgi:hypothetical protein